MRRMKTELRLPSSVPNPTFAPFSQRQPPCCPASPSRSPRGASVSTLSHIGGLAWRTWIEPKRSLTQALGSGTEDNLPKRQQDYRYDKRRDIIEQAEQQHAGEQVLAVHLPETDQHGRVEHPEPPRGMAGEAQKRCRDEDHRDHDEAQIGLIRHQHIHGQRAKTEIED